MRSTVTDRLRASASEQAPQNNRLEVMPPEKAAWAKWISEAAGRPYHSHQQGEITDQYFSVRLGTTRWGQKIKLGTLYTFFFLP